MLERIRTIVRHNCQLDPYRSVLVGVSGGPDSLCLLDIILRCGYSLVVAHLDHSLRSESEMDAQKVCEIAEALGVPFVVEKEDVPAFADAHGISLEEAARIVRYTFLFEQAGKVGAQAVAVGHTADDQVETVLMHLLRGTGISGLKGMDHRSLPTPWSLEIPLVRPLLSIWREEVEAYVAFRGLRPVWDASNQDTTFFRNRLRHELIPFLETYNPRIRRSLWRTAEILRGDSAILERVIDSAWVMCVSEETLDFIAFTIQTFRDQPLGVKRQLLRRAVSKLRPGLRDVDFDAVERAVVFLASPKRTTQYDLTAGLRLLLEKDKLLVVHWEADLPGADWPQLAAGELFELNIPGNITITNGWEMSSEEVVEDNFTLEHVVRTQDPYQAWIDYDSIRLPLNVRGRKPGDRFQPIGMGGHSVKISDFMINVKLPRRARNAWPLVLSGEDILWVPGYRLGHPFRLSAATRRIAHLRLTK